MTLHTHFSSAIEDLKSKLSRIRTGMASPAILDNVFVEYFGTMTPISQLSTISIADARTLSITPWEKDFISKIEKSILASNIGLQPMNNGTSIRLNMPILTTERRVELVKVVREICEKCRSSIRNIRRDEKQQITKLAKIESWSEDVLKDAISELQCSTDRFIGEVNDVLAVKEKEIMTV